MSAPAARRRALPEHVPLLLLVALLVIAPALVPTPYVLSVWTFIALNLIVVIALDPVVGYGGQLSLGQGVFVSVGAYCSALLTTAAGWSGWAAIPVGMVAAAALAVIVGIPTLRLRGYYLAMVTLGFPVVFDAIMREFSDWTGGSSGVISIPRLTVGAYELRDPLIFYYVVLAFALAVLVATWVFARSRWGIVLKTIHADEALAGAKGVNVARVKVAVFAASAAAAAISGSLYAHYVQFVAPDTFGILYSIMILVMLVVGGMGRVWGAVLGTIVMMWLPEILRTASHWEPVIFGAALAAIMLFAPLGLAGLFRRAPQPPSAAAPAEQAAGEPAQTPAPLLVLDGVGKRFGGVNALSEVGFSVSSGEIKAIIGPNGAGKSTMLAVISGAIGNDSGTVAFDNMRIDRWSPHRRAQAGIARTFQHARLVADLTVYENICLGLYPAPGLSEAKRRAEASRVMEEAGLTAFSDRYPGEIDQFACRLTEIAAAVASRPRLLLLDEPAAGLSESEVERLLHLLRTLRDRGMTIIVVDHVMQLVLGLADRVVVLDHGEMVVEEAAGDLMANAHVRKAYLGQSAEAADA